MQIGISIEKEGQDDYNNRQIIGVQLAYTHQDVQCGGVGINGVYRGKDSQSQYIGIQLAHELGNREYDRTSPHCMQDQLIGIQYVTRMPNGGLQSGGLSINIIGNASGKEEQEGLINIVFSGNPISQSGLLNLGPGFKISFGCNTLPKKSLETTISSN